jgi:WD40 repeat protein
VAFSPDGGKVLTGSGNNTAQLWNVPIPQQGDSERIKLWVVVLIGQELDQHGLRHALDAAT